MSTKSELSIKINKNGKVTICHNANLEDLQQMTEALINLKSKDEIKLFILSISTILKAYEQMK